MTTHIVSSGLCRPRIQAIGFHLPCGKQRVWDGADLYISLHVALKIVWGGFGQPSIRWIEIPKDTNLRWNGKDLIKMLLTNVKILPFTISQQIIFLLEGSMMQWKKSLQWKRWVQIQALLRASFQISRNGLLLSSYQLMCERYLELRYTVST